MSPSRLVHRSRIGVRTLLPAVAAVMAAQALHLTPADRQILTVMVFLSLLAGLLVSAFGYIAGRCMLTAGAAFGAGYRHHQNQQARQVEPPRLTVVE